MTDATMDRPSAGALLRAARERQGLHIAALAAAVKVAPRKLDALENDRWGELPDAAFTRALAQTVCRMLKVDARPVLDLLPHPVVGALEPGDGGLKTPFEGRPGRGDPGATGLAIRPMLLAAAALMVAALVLYFLPPGLWSPAESAGDGVAATAAVPLPAPLPASAATVAAVAPPDAAASAVVEAAPQRPAGETVFSSPAADAADAAGSAAAAAPAGMVQLRTGEASWIEVRDASGQILLSRNVLPGESVGLDGTLPIRLVIGNAAATQLGFRGQPVDLSPRTRDNVARVELR